MDEPGASGEQSYSPKTSYILTSNSEAENCELAKTELHRILSSAIESNGAYTVQPSAIENAFQDIFCLYGKNACYDLDTYLWNHLPGYTVRDATMRVVEDIMKRVINS